MFDFFDLQFTLNDGRLYISLIGDVKLDKIGGISEIQIAGENKNSHEGVKLGISSEGNRLRYIGHNIDGNVLTIELRAPSLRRRDKDNSRRFYRILG